MSASLTMAEVLAVVAPAFETTPHEVRSRRKSIGVAVARTAFCGISVEFTPRSIGEIARYLDRCPETAEKAAKERHPRFLRIDPFYKTRVWDIRQRLGEMRDALNPAADVALMAARRVVAAGAALTDTEIQAVCNRLIHVEQAFQELALFQMETSHER